jgi:hypothetical protein
MAIGVFIADTKLLEEVHDFFVCELERIVD